jgi:transposase
VQALRKIPGIGPLTATALFASIGNIHSFQNGRQLACWLGLTPREHSSGSRRRLGRMSKQGDVYLRTLLIHGARSALTAARRAAAREAPSSRLQEWMLQKADAAHTNKAAVAIANKLARIAWAVWHHERTFSGNYVVRKAA